MDMNVIVAAGLAGAVALGVAVTRRRRVRASASAGPARPRAPVTAPAAQAGSAIDVAPAEALQTGLHALALVRRSGGNDAPAASQTWCGMHVDRDSGAVVHQGSPMELAPRELALLRAVLVKPGQAIAKERLTELVFPGESQVQPEAIEVVAYRLRKKIAHTGAQLVTLRGLGYLLKAA